MRSSVLILNISSAQNACTHNWSGWWFYAWIKSDDRLASQAWRLHDVPTLCCITVCGHLGVVLALCRVTHLLSAPWSDHWKMTIDSNTVTNLRMIRHYLTDDRIHLSNTNDVFWLPFPVTNPRQSSWSFRVARWCSALFWYNTHKFFAHIILGVFNKYLRIYLWIKVSMALFIRNFEYNFVGVV